MNLLWNGKIHFDCKTYNSWDLKINNRLCKPFKSSYRQRPQIFRTVFAMVTKTFRLKKYALLYISQARKYLVLAILQEQKANK